MAISPRVSDETLSQLTYWTGDCGSGNDDAGAYQVRIIEQWETSRDLDSISGLLGP